MTTEFSVTNHRQLHTNNDHAPDMCNQRATPALDRPNNDDRGSEWWPNPDDVHADEQMTCTPDLERVRSKG